MKIKEEFIFKGFKCSECGEKIKCTNIYHLTPKDNCKIGCSKIPGNLIADVESIFTPLESTDFSIAFTKEQMKDEYNKGRFSSILTHHN
jgi:hypothetical protein